MKNICKGVYSHRIRQRPQGPQYRQDQSAVQPDQTAAYMLRKRCAHRRPAFLFTPNAYQQQRSGHDDDRGDAPVLPARHV